MNLPGQAAPADAVPDLGPCCYSWEVQPQLPCQTIG
jgi:hypothetical protein